MCKASKTNKKNCAAIWISAKAAACSPLKNGITLWMLFTFDMKCKRKHAVGN